MAALVRNQVGGIWQAGAGAGGASALKQMRQAVDNLPGTVGAAIGKMGKKGAKWGGEVGADLRALDDIVQGSRSADEALAALRAQGKHAMAEAVEEGVFDTFVSSEGLLRQMSRSAKKQKFQDFLDMPGEMFQYLENAMRWGMFKDLRAGGISAKVAAQKVADSFLDYGVHSAANRTLRDLIPFAAFQAGSIPQSASLLARRPAVGVGLASLMKGGDEPVSPWISDQPYVELGDDQYLTSLGLPV